MCYGDYALLHEGGECTFVTDSNTSHGFAIKPEEFVDSATFFWSFPDFFTIHGGGH